MEAYTYLYLLMEERNENDKRNGNGRRGRNTRNDKDQSKRKINGCEYLNCEYLGRSARQKEKWRHTCITEENERKNQPIVSGRGIND